MLRIIAMLVTIISSAHANDELRGRRILILDHDVFQHNVLGFAMSGWGLHRIEHAFTRQQALNIVSRLDFDIVLASLDLPKVKFAELINEIRKVHPRITILLRTPSLHDAMEWSEGDLVSGVIQKNLPLSELKFAMETHLERSEREACSASFWDRTVDRIFSSF